MLPYRYDERGPVEGDTRHVFGVGWQRRYGDEWISVDLWLKIKIAGL